MDCGEKGKKEKRQREMASNPMGGGMNWFMRGCQTPSDRDGRFGSLHIIVVVN